MIKRKVLIVITTDFVPYGGLTTVMMNYYRAMNKENLQIDFASTNDPCDELKRELAQNDSKYFDLGSRKHSPMYYIKKLAAVLKKEKYDVVHVNGNSSTMAMELVTAKLVGVPSRISHVHTTQSKYPYANVVLHPIFAASYTKALAVSKQAGDWLYGKNYTLLNNAINTAKYKFNVDVREKIRKKYELTGKFVIGTVGKLNPPKNHIHLLQTFAEYSKKDETAMLVIAGGGELEQYLKAKAAELGVASKVIFLGMYSNIAGILQAFDTFVFPSLFEGLGLAIIEAQAAGLPCIASTAVPQETNVTPYISYLDLDSDTAVWVDKIAETKVQMLNTDRLSISEKARECIREHGYEISCEAEKLENIYNS